MSYVKSLPRHSYFTICQYDDGPLVDVPDCLVFSAGGLPDNAEPIPLLSNCHPEADFDKDERSTLASFVGRIKTHKIRQVMKNILDGKESIDILAMDHKHSIDLFREKMQESYFALCPRGYGKTSFRMYEAIQFGCIPVYISDEHWLPFQQYINWNEFAVIVKPEEIESIPDRLRKIITSSEYDIMKAKLKEVYYQYFNYQGTFYTIKRILEDENNKRGKGRFHIVR